MAFKFSESVVPVTELKSRSKELIEKAQQSQFPILITQRGKAAAFLVGVEAYEAREERFELIEKVMEGLRQAEKGELYDHEEALKILKSF